MAGNKAVYVYLVWKGSQLYGIYSSSEASLDAAEWLTKQGFSPKCEVRRLLDVFHG